MGRISRRLERLPGSATLAISAKARKLKAEGRDVISFGAGEPDFDTPENVVKAAAEAVADPANHHYTSNLGLAPLREAAARYTGRYSGVEVGPESVMVTNGAKQAIFQVFAALLDPEDEVLLPSPHWVTYPAAIDLAGGRAVSIPTDMGSGFKVTVEQLEQARTPKTKLLMFVSPSNPTGAVYDAGEAREIGQWAAEHGIWVVADEIYQRLVYGGEEVAPSIVAETPGLEDWVIINGVAKSFAMTGWRVGWMVGPEDVISAAERHQSHATSNVNNISQMAAVEALNGPQESVEMMRLVFDRRRKKMLEMLDGAPGVECVEPEGAFYVFPSVTGLLGDRYPTSVDLAEGLIEEAGVAVVPGESFGAPGYLRLSYALSDEALERGVSRMVSLFESI